MTCPADSCLPKTLHCHPSPAGCIPRGDADPMSPSSPDASLHSRFFHHLQTSDFSSSGQLVTLKTLDLPCKCLLKDTVVETLLRDSLNPRGRGVDRLERRGHSLLYTFLIYNCHLCDIYINIYISIYCVYICNILYFSWIHFYHFKKCVFHISWTIFLAVIQLCILYTHMVFSNKILLMYYFKCYAWSLCESLPERERGRKQCLSFSICEQLALDLMAGGMCWALGRQRCPPGRQQSPGAQCGPVWSRG